ncbi:GNAT family N-acetyltransferase [Yinghuangia seranimata]|uniref:GNAT family N-acetyltransferase n=1 Tax=Yinghuangia seranimata TaxID=408067 RepID=UPI00248D056F|nr:GNAT family N-acetyltransferase [Yinghuangia seranimata]MDI2130184.1 GNAT family N-acetyltransferase [Yinghuangia seranimata]
MTSAGEGGFHLRELAKDDDPQVLALLEAALAGGPTGERTQAFFDWKHRDNPFGASPGLVAEDADGRIVAVRLFLRWEFVHQGEVVRAVRAVDTATHPAAQGRGLFKKLTSELLDRLSADTDLVFNTPNANSLPGYLKMGWREVGKVPVSLHPIRPIAFAKGLRELRGGEPDKPRSDAGSDGFGRRGAVSSSYAGGRDTSLLPPLPDAAASRADGAEIRCRFPTARQFFADPVATNGLAELIGDADSADAALWPDRLRTRPTDAYLRWRYGEAPGLDYRVVAAYRRGVLDGVAFGRPRMRGPLAEFTLSQLLIRPGDRLTARRLLSAAGLSGCDHVATHLTPGSDAARAARYAGYAVPPRTGMLLVARPLRPLPYDLDPYTLNSWHLALGDLEVF